MKKTRWGIIGTGNIAKKFATAVNAHTEAELVAVGSRSQESAQKFGEEFKVPHRHAGYDALVADPDVDVVYVATPHPFHREHSILALNAGKPVLCEKPFAINAKEAREVISVAKRRKLFLMEGMWSRCYPLMHRVRQMLKEGAIGEPKMLAADFGFAAGFNPQSRLFDPKLGGGALMDVGVYCVSLSSMIFGTPTNVATLATLGETGVDEQAAFVLSHEKGEMSMLYTAIRTTTPHEAVIMGTGGRIRIHGPWWKPAKLTLSVGGKDDQVIDMPFEGNGFKYEIEEVMNCLLVGKHESDVMPLEETLSIMKTMDKIRAKWGLKYPMEQ
jgi:predicted dehydrogenase